LRDPADDEIAQAGVTDRVRQSRFRTTLEDLTRVTVFGTNGSVKTLWRLGAAPASGGTSRLLDGWVAVWPQVFLFLDGDGFSVTGQEVNFGGTQGAAAGGAPTSTTLRFAAKGIIDAVFVPRTGEVVYARRGGSRLHAVNVITRAERTLGLAPAGTVDLEIDAQRSEVLALGARQLVRVDPSDGSRVRRTLPRSRFDSVSYDATTDRAAVISSTTRELRLFGGDALTAAGTRLLPLSVTSGSGRLQAGFDDRGGLVLHREGSTAIRRGSVGVRIGVRPSTRTARAAQGRGFAVTDRGTTLVLAGGRLVEIGKAGKPVAGSPFARIRGRGRLAGIIHAGDYIDPTTANVIADQTVDDPQTPELARRPLPGAPQGLRVLDDDAADAAADAVAG
jgi:hypothetical protein